MSEPFTVQGTVRLQPGREASVLRRHPWIYRGALATPVPAGLAPVRVLAADGGELGVALPGGSGGSLALRMVAFGGEAWSAAALHERLLGAAALRERLRLDADAYRLVHAEGDDLPGLVIDCYAAIAVCELYEPAWEGYLAEVADVLTSRLGFAGLLLRRAWRRGAPVEVVSGPALAEPVTISESAVRFAVDLAGGQKTGFFLDQRENRRLIAALAPDATVLNLFSYSGGFALPALLRGARTAINVDASAAALGLARESYRLNSLPLHDGDFILGDVFHVARDLLAAVERFDIVVADPPAFVKGKGELAAGLRGYKDINLQAMRLVSPGGLLFTCCCSALVSEDHFAQVLFAAALDAGRRVRVLERRGAGPDHPVSVFCPEARHLKAWLCEVN